MSDITPILLLGAGRMGGALIEGWYRTEAFPEVDLIAVEPNPSAALAASDVLLNPPDLYYSRGKTVLLAVKPQMWRAAAAQYAPHLAEDAVIVSIAAGISAADIAEGFGGRRVARVMPTTAVSIAKGTASIYAADPVARARAHALFDPIATAVDLDDEALMHAATGVSGSAPISTPSLKLLRRPASPPGSARTRPRPWPAPPSPAQPRCSITPAKIPPNCAARSPRPAAPPPRRSRC